MNYIKNMQNGADDNKEFEESFGVTPMPVLGQLAPAFEADTTLGPIKFPDDYEGKWVLLFTYPADHCTVCATELLEATKYQDQFNDINVELVAVSVDSLLSHFSFLKDLYDLEFDEYSRTTPNFPLVADPDKIVAKKYGMLSAIGDTTRTIRGLFLIDPSGVIRASMQYPLEVGRDGEEIFRMVQAVQKVTSEDVYTPAGWKPGDDVLVTEPKTIKEATDNLRRDVVDQDVFCPDWFICYQKDNSVTTQVKRQSFNKSNSPFNNFK